MVAPFLGGHWSVVVPPVVSASPVRHWADATLAPGLCRPEMPLHPSKKKKKYKKKQRRVGVSHQLCGGRSAAAASRNHGMTPSSSGSVIGVSPGASLASLQEATGAVRFSVRAPSWRTTACASLPQGWRAAGSADRVGVPAPSAGGNKGGEKDSTYARRRRWKLWFVAVRQ